MADACVVCREEYVVVECDVAEGVSQVTKMVHTPKAMVFVGIIYV